MTPLTVLLLLQETLPPPPTPTSSPDINTAQVIGIVVISLALIVIAAIAVRPLVSRLIKPKSKKNRDLPLAPSLPETSPKRPESSSRSIIQFPKQTLTPLAASDQSWQWPESEGSIEERFKRVVSESSRRRKLGDRQPNVARGAVPTRVRSLATEHPSANAPRTTPLMLTPIVPLNARRPLAPPRGTPVGVVTDLNGRVSSSIHADAQPKPIPMTPDSGVVPGTLVSTEPFVIVRRDVNVAPTLEQVNGTEFPTVSDDSQVWHAVVEELDIGKSLEIPPTGNTGVQEQLVASVQDIPHEEIKEAESGGKAPSEADLELVALTLDIEEPAADATYNEPEIENRDRSVDERTLAGISQLVRELIYCANAGKLLNGFALYSDPYLFRFMDSTGLDEAGFRDRFSSVPPRPATEWERLDRLSEVEYLPDGRVSAIVSYVDNSGRPTNGRERFRFLYSEDHSMWMIDDIQAMGAEKPMSN